MRYYGGRTMRGKLAKFLIADNAFDIISKCGNTTVPYMKKSANSKKLELRF